MKKKSKSEAEKEIKNFFENIEEKSTNEVKKIKKLAMNYNIPLRGLRKKFCKKCLSPIRNSKIRINQNVKEVICKNCGHVNRWKIKTS